MKKQLYLCLFVLSSISLFAQVQQGGTPYSSSHLLPNYAQEVIHFPTIDLEALAAEDAIFDLQKDIPYRFGFNFFGNYSLTNSGEWTILPNGDRIWRIQFYSTGAQTLNFLLENYVLASGCSLFFYNEDKSVVFGGFTEKNNELSKNLVTMPIPGEKITLEFYEPKAVSGNSTFEVTRITHGYRSIKIPTKGVGTSGNCNNNVICAVGDDWRDQIRSVGIIIVNGNGNCTGALINNTCEDKKPYFLTANHCLGGNVTTWNIGFNWESATCNSNSGFQNISLESVNVMALRASNSASDFALLELTQTPPDSYDVFFAGWDRTGTIPERQIGIHHPDGDLKKISFDNDPAATANWSGAATWHIFDWDDGTTEPGSSGSPLFDQNKRIIGQLYGGTANCNNNVDDYYGRFNVSWDGGNNTNNELISWLDACGTNVTVLDGLDGNVALENDVAIAFENKPNVENCGTNIPQRIILTNNGSNAVTAVSFEYGLSDNVQTYNWTGNLAEGQSTTITLDKLYLCKGSYNYVLSILSSNLAVDQKPLNNTANFSFSVVNGSAFEAVIKTNFSGAESSFELYNSSNQIIYSGSGYGNNTTNTINYCLPYGDYIFKMKDSGGNGLTPTFVIDNGFYTLSINGTQIHTNSAFGAEESISFHIDANGISADFIVPPVIVNTPITLFSNSAGNPTAYTWEAPAANTTLGNNISFNTTFSIEGTFPVVLTIETDTACDFISKDVIVTKNTVGIDDLNNNLNIQLYPNPSNGVFTLIGKDVKNAQLQIYNVLGQLVLQQLMINDEEIISLPNLSEGVFQIVITNSNKQTMLNHIIK